MPQRGRKRTLIIEDNCKFFVVEDDYPRILSTFAAKFSNNRNQKEIITSKKTKKAKMILVFSVSFDVVI